MVCHSFDGFLAAFFLFHESEQLFLLLDSFAMIRAMMLWALVLLSSIPPLAAMPMRLPSLDDDTTCSVGESGTFGRTRRVELDGVGI